jgi:23S rRNA (cytidine1920-2'-O)/16S rRNA (cytidine1409-2'-O)-methyltransferase
VAGAIITKPAFKVSSDVDIEILEERLYVSRSALKLKYFLENNNIDIINKTAMDIGSSTGGFTEVLIEYGIQKVISIDVGKNQMNEKIKNNSKVYLYEELDIRDFNTMDIIDIIVCDVSFISLKHIIEKIKSFNAKDNIILFKPQFEVGIDAKRDRSGVVIDDNAIKLSMLEFEKRVSELNLHIKTKEKSKVSGKEGNIEYIYHLLHN